MAAETPEGQPQTWWSRLAAASKQSGPGWLLSAYTLGSGSAVGSLWAGAKYGYTLLWVQPLSMIMGVLMLSAAAYVFLRNDERPYRLFWNVSPALALAWALGSLFASVIWHFPQYGLAYEAVRELGGFEPSRLSQVLVGGSILVLSTALTWSYAAGGKGLTFYETVIKVMVWLMVICLAIVVLQVQVEWGEVIRGLVSFQHPTDADGRTVLLSLLSAAVGINMTFLYPYSVQSKEWSGDHMKVAVADLIKGMMLPFVCATGLLVIASAATIHATGGELNKGNITAMAAVFEPVFGGRAGPILFNLGLLAMPLSSITLHMLTCGFIVSEMAGEPKFGKAWKLGSLAPAIGALGVAVPLRGWLPVTASALTLVFLPIAYVGFAALFSRQLRSDPPEESARYRWLIWPLLVIVAVIGLLALQKAGASVQALIRMAGGG